MRAHLLFCLCLCGVIVVGTGEVYVSGMNSFGALGLGGGVMSTNGTFVRSPFFGGVNRASRVACGAHHAVIRLGTRGGGGSRGNSG
jgi:alpha-tubulin suppressor-like RCC1 family protein